MAILTAGMTKDMRTLQASPAEWAGVLAKMTAGMTDGQAERSDLVRSIREAASSGQPRVRLTVTTEQASLIGRMARQ